MSLSSDRQQADHSNSRRLQLEESADEGRYTLVLSGEVDLLVTSDLEAALRRLCVAGTTAITLDLRDVTFMDSSGLRTMLVAQRLCQEHGYELSLIPGPEAVQSLFQMTGLAELLPFQTDERPPPLAKEAILPKLFAPADADGQGSMPS